MLRIDKKNEKSQKEIESEVMDDLGDSDGFDDETETPTTDHEGTQYYCDAEFKIKQVSDPKIFKYTVETLFAASCTDKMKLDPQYQRDVVWDEGRSSELIASIFQGYFIPPIIFNVLTKDDESGSGTQTICRVCVDGKQRITSIRNFMEGRIGVLDSCSPPQKWYFCHPIINGVQQESSHDILPESTKKFFGSRALCCFEYRNLPISVEENMFQLVQRGVPLTPAERMRALSTNWANFGKRIEQDYPQVVNLSKQTRASGFRCVITILIQVREVISRKDKKISNEGHGSNSTLHAAPHILTRLLLDEKSLKNSDKIKYEEVFEKFQELVDLSSTKSQHTKLGYTIMPDTAFHTAPNYLNTPETNHVKTFSPLELVATGTLIAVHGASRTSATLLDNIKEMRIFLRHKHQDLRLNSQCWATAWSFISRRVANLQGDGQVVLAGSTSAVGEADMDIDE